MNHFNSRGARITAGVLGVGVMLMAAGEARAILFDTAKSTTTFTHDAQEAPNGLLQKTKTVGGAQTPSALPGTPQFTSRFPSVGGFESGNGFTTAQGSIFQKSSNSLVSINIAGSGLLQSNPGGTNFKGPSFLDAIPFAQWDIDSASFPGVNSLVGYLNFNIAGTLGRGLSEADFDASMEWHGTDNDVDDPEEVNKSFKVKFAVKRNASNVPTLFVDPSSSLLARSFVFSSTAGSGAFSVKFFNSLPLADFQIPVGGDITVEDVFTFSAKNDESPTSIDILDGELGITFAGNEPVSDALLAATPEPATFTLGMIALGGTALTVLRRKR